VIWTFYEGNDLGDLLDYQRHQDELDQLPRVAPLRDRTFLDNAATAIWKALLGCTLDERAATRHGLLRVGGDVAPAKTWFVDGETPAGPREARAFEQLRGILGRAFAATRAAGADFVVACAPTKWRVHAGLVELPADSELAVWPRSDLHVRLRELLATISPEIGFVDLAEALREQVARGELVYLLDDTHWTPDGHESVARAVARYLEERQGPSPRPAR
jgi:hypothetical protein